MRFWKYLSDIEFGTGVFDDPLKVKIFIIVLVLIIAGGMGRKDKTLVCQGQYNYCSLESRNYFNIPKTKKMFIPNNITGFFIDSYQYRRRYSRYRSELETRYRLYATDKNGKTIEIDNNYLSSPGANSVLNSIQTCFTKTQYPCRIKL